jgi:hypothetical protein
MKKRAKQHLKKVNWPKMLEITFILHCERNLIFSWIFFGQILSWKKKAQLYSVKLVQKLFALAKILFPRPSNGCIFLRVKAGTEALNLTWLLQITNIESTKIKKYQKVRRNWQKNKKIYWQVSRSLMQNQKWIEQVSTTKSERILGEEPWSSG